MDKRKRILNLQVINDHYYIITETPTSLKQIQIEIKILLFLDFQRI